MMKKNAKVKLLLTVFCMFFIFSFRTIPAQAAKVTKVCDHITKTTTVRQDITRDGKKDTLRFKLTMDEEEYAVEKVQVYVNGKKALTLNNKNAYYYSLTVQYLYLSKSREFLQIYGTGDNDYVVSNAIYSYNAKTKKLQKILDLSSSSMIAQDVVSATGSQIRIEYTGQPSETGWLKCRFTYVYKNGGFQLKSNSTTSVKSVLGSFGDYKNDGLGTRFAKNQFVVSNKRTFYTGTSLQQAAFTAQKGDILTLRKLRIIGKNVYLQFVNSSGTTGWQKVFGSDVYDYSRSDMEKSGWFDGVFYRLAG